MVTRRTFIETVGGSLGLALVPVATSALSSTRGNVREAHDAHHCHRGPVGPHPTPRPGITGDKVLKKEQLTHAPDLAPLFDDIRAIPGVVDGIHCNCGCASIAGYYSLLSCYEGEGMAQHCPVCQGQGKIAVRLHKEGKSLDDIRAAIDAKYGDPS